MMTRVEVTALDDLHALKRTTDLDEVAIGTHGFKFRGALRHALKYGLWAVKPGGLIVVMDTGPRSFHVSPYTVPFSVVRQQVFKVLGRDAELVELDEERMTITLRRTSPVLGGGWTAGVMFSGQASEVPLIEKAIEGLKAQPELARETGGEIIVSGPGKAAQLVAGIPDVEYLAYDDPGSRAMITRKKNAIVAHTRNPRLLLQHARIVLPAGCLAALPREFDVITPRVEYRSGDRAVPHLDFFVGQFLDTEGLTTREAPIMRDDRQDYLHALKYGRPYASGALFAVRREVALDVPLNPNLGWGEGEDADWCAMLHANGYLVDVEPEAVALSQTFRDGRTLWLDHPLFFAFARRLSRLWRRIRGFSVHLFEMAIGRR